MLLTYDIHIRNIFLGLKWKMLFLMRGMLLYGIDTNSKISARLKYCQGRLLESYETSL